MDRKFGGRRVGEIYIESIQVEEIEGLWVHLFFAPKEPHSEDCLPLKGYIDDRRPPGASPTSEDIRAAVKVIEDLIAKRLQRDRLATKEYLKSLND